MAASREDREYIRVNDTFKVRIVAHDGTDAASDIDIKTSDSINVSANGLLVSARTRIELDSIVTIVFLKPHSFDFFKSKGRVVRTEKNPDGSYKIAINFINVSTDDMKTLDYYLRLASSG